MKQFLREYLRPYMVRPVIHRAFSRFASALALALLWNRFVNTGNPVSMSRPYSILGSCFLASAWFGYLRMDGIDFSPTKWLSSITEKTEKRFRGAFSSIPDYLDEPKVSLADLTEHERDACCLFADIVCGAIFLVWSLV